MHTLFDRCAKIGQNLLPGCCALCGDTTPAGLCDACAMALRPLPGSCCRICAAPIDADTICGDCLHHPPAFDQVKAGWLYAEPLATLITRCKYSREWPLARLLAEMLGPAPQPPNLHTASVLLPVPLHPERLRERGFNQAMELARIASKRYRWPLRSTLLQRVKPAPAQAGLRRRERQKNLKNAFAVREDLTGMQVIVMDDVLTTGATLHEVARVLKQAGAVWVGGWVLARTP